MDIYRKNKVKIIFFIAFLSLFASCKSSKITSIEETKEVITKRNPYRLSSVSTIEIDSVGFVKPVVLDLTIGNTKSEVSIKGTEVTHTLENKDTVVTSKIIEKKKEIVITELPKELTWWGKVKKRINTIAIYSLILNVLFIGYKITKYIRKIYLPI